MTPLHSSGADWYAIDAAIGSDDPLTARRKWPLARPEERYPGIAAFERPVLGRRLARETTVTIAVVLGRGKTVSHQAGKRHAGQVSDDIRRRFVAGATVDGEEG